MLLAVLLGNQLARPLLVLAEGVREVAAGNLSPKAALQSKDELGGLTRSFALMTQQLADARQAVEQSMGAVDASRANLQTILDNLTAGVIVLDAQGLIRSSNPGATRILRAPMAAYEGRPLSEVPGRHPPLAEPARDLVDPSSRALRRMRAYAAAASARASTGLVPASTTPITSAKRSRMTLAKSRSRLSGRAASIWRTEVRPLMSVSSIRSVSSRCALRLVFCGSKVGTTSSKAASSFGSGKPARWAASMGVNARWYKRSSSTWPPLKPLSRKR